MYRPHVGRIHTATCIDRVTHSDTCIGRVTHSACVRERKVGSDEGDRRTDIIDIACIQTYMHTYIHTYKHTCIHIYTRIHIHIRILNQDYIRTYIHTVYTHTHTHTHTHTQKHTYIHTYIVYGHAHLAAGILEEVGAERGNLEQSVRSMQPNNNIKVA